MNNNLQKTKKVPAIDATQLKTFIKFLPKEIKLLVETYKFASEMYAWIGLQYRWVELFALPANAISNDNIPPRIRLDRFSRYGSKGEIFFAIALPNKLGRRLVAHVKINADGFLFRQKNGKPFDSIVLAQEFFKASDRAYKKKVIKKHLVPRDLITKPRSDIAFERGSLSSVCFRPELVKAIPKEKVVEISKIIPSHYHNAGCHRDHTMHDILQALLAQEDFNLTRKEFKRYFPKIWSAAESQKSRWKGVWNQILGILSTLQLVMRKKDSKYLTVEILDS